MRLSFVNFMVAIPLVAALALLSMALPGQALPAQTSIRLPMQSTITTVQIGSQIVRAIVADKLHTTHIALVVTRAADGRYNVATSIYSGDQLKFPSCDYGYNWYLMSQFEKSNARGDRMEINQQCVIGIISAKEVTRRVAERLAKMGIKLEDADWELVQKMTELVLREWANLILAR